MQHITHYDSSLGRITLAGDHRGLTGLWFEGEKGFSSDGGSDHVSGDFPALSKTKEWLDAYFAGEEPDFMPPIHMTGTEFQKEVWKLLLEIPYGETTTYGEIARQIAERRGVPRMSAQAVGGAVGRNDISIIIPCHRVVGTNGNLTGYAGGIEKKIWLLKWEGVDMGKWFIPKKKV